MARMNNASSSTAQKVASKISGSGKQSSNSGNANTGAITSESNGVGVAVPAGLHVITPDTVGSMMPKFDPNVFNVGDPLNPSPSMPQATKEQHSRGMAIYEGAGRALDLYGGAFDVSAKNFTVLGKQAKAVGAGVKAATAIEATKGDVFDYMKQQQVTEQKGIDYGIATYTTQINRQVAGHTQTELNEKLTQASIKAQDAQLKTVEKQQSLDGFRAQLGQYMPDKN